MVGKVTVAMLERNLFRLFDNFHHPYQAREHKKEEKPWYEHMLQVYTAVTVTALLAIQVMRK
jgi:hypothetical protein